MVPSLKTLPYPQGLRKLQLPSFVHRRRKGGMIEVYKYLHDLYNAGADFLHLHRGERTRGHSLKLEKSFTRLDVRKLFFSHRVVDSWNDLPEEVASAPSVNSFKNRLDKH